jgi:hypothetical protein
MREDGCMSPSEFELLCTCLVIRSVTAFKDSRLRGSDKLTAHIFLTDSGPPRYRFPALKGPDDVAAMSLQPSWLSFHKLLQTFVSLKSVLILFRYQYIKITLNVTLVLRIHHFLS